MFPVDEQYSINAISRRSFLQTTVTSAGIGVQPRAKNRTLIPDVDVQMEVWRVERQLRHFASVLLPLLLRRSTWEPAFHFRAFTAPLASDMAAYREATGHLINALPARVGRAPIEPYHHHDVVAPLLALKTDPRGSGDCYRFHEAKPHVGRWSYCRGDVKGLRWHLYSMWSRIPPDWLETFAEEIDGFVDGPAQGECPLDSVRQASPEQLVHAFKAMPLETYWKLIQPLFHIVPTAPTKLLTVRRGNARMRIAGITRCVEHGYLHTSNISMLASDIMEYFASNFFSRIQEIAALPETSGNWHGFMAGQIFNVLYRKVIVLRQLCVADEQAINAIGRKEPLPVLLKSSE